MLRTLIFRLLSLSCIQHGQDAIIDSSAFKLYLFFNVSRLPKLQQPKKQQIKKKLKPIKPKVAVKVVVVLMVMTHALIYVLIHVLLS